jgi:hypothetical protein
MPTPWLAVVIAALLLTCACTGSDPDQDAPSRGGSAASPVDIGEVCMDILATPEKHLSEPTVAQVSRHEANVVVQVNSSSGQTQRISVTLDGALAVDTELPAVPPSSCQAGPVYEHAYRFAPGTVRLTATTGEGRQRSIDVDARSGRVWVVVLVQPGVRPFVRASPDRPLWAA